MMLMIIVLEIISFTNYPLSLFFTDFLPPFNFILNAIGIIPSEEQIEEVVKDVQHEGFESMIERVMVSCVLYLMLTIICNNNQDMTVWLQGLYFTPLFMDSIILYIQRKMAVWVPSALMMKDTAFHINRTCPKMTRMINYIRL